MYEVIVVFDGIEQMTCFDDLEQAKAYADKCVDDGAISASIYPVRS